jgi:hypothetical protein
MLYGRSRIVIEKARRALKEWNKKHHRKPGLKTKNKIVLKVIVRLFPEFKKVLHT